MLRGDLSAKSLQRAVGLLSAAACVFFATLNAFTLVARGTRLAFILFQPAVFVILALAAVFYLSGLFHHWTMRTLQVVAYLIGGLLTSVGAAVGDLTAELFVIYALYLFNEYGEPGHRIWPSVGIAIAYLVASILLGERPSTVASVVNHVAFATAVAGLYALVVFRQIEIRRRYSDDLEAQVLERTNELEQQTHELQSTLKQRNSLIQEIHHRIGNSLQILSSYISLQSASVDPASNQILKETELRIHAISDVHAKLYATHAFSHIELDEYVAELLYDMDGAYASSASIQIETSTRVLAHIDFAVPFGIILNELVTNAVKHGHVGAEKVAVSVRASRIDDRIGVLVRDEGIGFASDQIRGIGTEVVDALVSQLDGTISRSTANGAIVSLEFPLGSVRRTDSHTSGMISGEGAGFGVD